MASEPTHATSTSPHDPTDVIVEHASASAADVAAAAATAREAQRVWWSQGAAKRAVALDGAAAALERIADRAVELVIREVGKPRLEAAGEVARTSAILRYYAQASFSADGATYPPSLGGMLVARRRPHGVAGLITPWNFPLAIPIWKAAPALAAGNAVLIKPSPDAMAGADLLAELLAEFLPAGLFTAVHGGAETGAAVVAESDVVSFTGSSAVGRAVVVDAAAHGVPVQAEMGGQNAAIVLPDADAARVAAMVAGAAMGYAGQKCTATRRIIVVGDGTDVVDALAEAVQAMAPRDPSEPGHAVGPVINAASRDRVLAAIWAGVAAGGRVLAGGPDAAVMPSDGWYVHPTLLDGVPTGHPLSCEETFGPLAVIQRVATVAEAVELANSVRYGLVSSVHGRDLDSLLACADALHTGLVKVNAPTTGVDFYAPFGGDKDSSYGQREQGTAGIDFYSTTRTIAIVPHG
ncbi:MAG: aldehyde dehydrogenase [Ilumatobacteraceae bacterium]|nr:aldehyde dehydrogenase [Ilumatobacteraceae bacterium]